MPKGKFLFSVIVSEIFQNKNEKETTRFRYFRGFPSISVIKY